MRNLPDRCRAVRLRSPAVWLVIAAVACCPAVVYGQTASGNPMSAAPLAADATRRPAPAGPTSTPVAPAGTAAVTGAAADEATARGPAYGLNAVRLTGAVEDGRVRVDADVELVVNREAEWVRVPLGFPEAILATVEHEGAGEASFDAFTKESGYAWWLSGRGAHRLRLTLWAPVGGTAANPRLALTTPPNAATTTFELDLPAEAAPAAAEGMILSTTAADDRTRVDWIGAGGKFDLTWHSKPSPSGPSDLQVETNALVRAAGKTVELSVLQRVNVASGAVDSVQMRLPDAFTLLDVDGDFHASHAIEEREGVRFATVTLTERRSEAFDLKWTFEAPVPAPDATLPLDGLELAGVAPAAQSGTVSLEGSSAFRISNRRQEARGVRPVEMSEQAAAAGFAAIYEFESQPFRLDLRFEAVPPHFSVAPVFTFDVRADRLEFEGDFRMAVTRGEVGGVRLLWPDAAGWTVSPVRAPGLTEVSRQTAGPLTVDVGFAAAATSATKPSRVPIRAARPLAVTGETLTVSLPRIESADQGEAVLRVLHPEGMTVDLTTATGGAIPVLNEVTADALGFPAPAADERCSWFLAPRGLSAVAITARRLARTVEVDSLVTVHPRGENLSVEQRLDYVVRNGSMPSVRLTIPTSLLGKVRFTDGGGRPLVPQRADVKAGDRARIVLPLPGAVTGRTSVTAQYSVASAGPGGGTLSLPLATASEADSSSVRLRIGRLPRHTVEVADDRWARLHLTESDGLDRWAAADAAEVVPLRLAPRPAGGLVKHVVSRLLLRTSIDRKGAARTVADAKFDVPPATLALVFPPGVVPESFAWGGGRVQPELIRQPDGSLIAELSLPRPVTDPVLSVVFRSAEPGVPLRLAGRRTLHAFRFAPDIGVEQTLWRVALPDSQHLFAAPEDYVPRFRWGFSRGLWARRTEPGFDRPDAWFGATPITADPESEPGQQYVFSRLGPADPMTFTTAARSLVVLLGAGVAIVLGYAFVNGLVPRRRIAVAVAGAAALLAWAVFPNQSLIFVQPVAFGLVLVAVAAGAEWFLRRRLEQISSVAGPASAVDFVTIVPGDGSNSGPRIEGGIGSEEPTVLRPGRMPEPAGRES